MPGFDGVTMRTERIFFDMDGVLADFDNGVRALCRMEPVPQNEKRYPGYDDILWEHVKQVDHFYDLLQPMEGAVELFHRVYDRYGDRVEILTGIPKPRRGINTAKEDKIAWVKRVLSDRVVIHTVYREQKKDFCTGEGCVLIDDLKTTIRDWRIRGGIGILHVNAAQTSDELETLRIL